LFEIKIKNKPNIFFPKSFSDELRGMHGHHKLEENLSVLKDDGRQGQAYGRMARDGVD
jgi:hypothetical protein